MSIKNRIVFKGKLKDYPGAEALSSKTEALSSKTEALSSTTALTEALSSTAVVTGNTITAGLNTDHGKGVTICKAKDCNNTLYGWTSPTNKEYCLDCV